MVKIFKILELRSRGDYTDVEWQQAKWEAVIEIHRCQNSADIMNAIKLDTNDVLPIDVKICLYEKYISLEENDLVIVREYAYYLMANDEMLDSKSDYLMSLLH